jgi:hypothetical protein
MAIVRQDALAHKLAHKPWDILGVALSLLCVVHCMAMPLVIAYLPLVGLEGLAREGFHRWVAVAAMAIGGMSFVPGYLRHRRTAAPLLGGAGLLLLCSSALSGHDQCCGVAAADQPAAGQSAQCGEVRCIAAPPISGESETRPSVARASLPGLERAWTPLGGLLLMIAHTLNCRWTRCCQNGNCRSMRTSRPHEP